MIQNAKKNLLDKKLTMYFPSQYIQCIENGSLSLTFLCKEMGVIFSGELHIRDVGKSDEDVGYSCQYRDEYSGKVAFSQVWQLILSFE